MRRTLRSAGPQWNNDAAYCTRHSKTRLHVSDDPDATRDRSFAAILFVSGGMAPVRGKPGPRGQQHARRKADRIVVLSTCSLTFPAQTWANYWRCRQRPCLDALRLHGQCAMPVARLLPPGLLGDGWGSSLIIIAWVLKLSSTNDTCVPHLPPMLCRTVYAHSIPARCPSVSRSLRDFFAHFPHARVGPLARAGGGCRDVG